MLIEMIVFDDEEMSWDEEEEEMTVTEFEEGATVLVMVGSWTL